MNGRAKIEVVRTSDGHWQLSDVVFIDVVAKNGVVGVLEGVRGQLT